MMAILHRLFVLMAFCAATMSVESNAAERQPLIVAHRGLLLHAPENTLANFRACLELRIGFEFDVERTKDGHLICIHDDAAAVANNAEEFAEALAAPDADWVYVRFLPTKEQIEAVHQAKKRAFIAGPTVSGNVPKNWLHAAHVGIDAILTDYPLSLRSTSKSR